MPFNNGELVKFDVGDLPDQEFTNGNGSKKKKASPKKDSIETKSPDEVLWDKMENPPEQLEIKPFVVVDNASLESLVKKLEKADAYAIDLETTGLNTLNCEIVGWAIAIQEKKDIKTFYIPILHQNVLQLPSDSVLDILKPILEDDSKLQIMQNAKFERKIFTRLGVKCHGNFFDTMLASYIENSSNKHGLKAQSVRVLNKRMTEIEELIGTGKKQITIDQVPIDKVSAYAAADAFVTYELYKHYDKKLSKKEKELLFNIEQPLAAVLAEIEIEGISIDAPFFSELSEEISKKIEDLEKKIWKACDKEFNISSTKQLGVELYETLELPEVKKRTKTGAYPTDSGTLESLINEYEISKKQKETLEAVLEYRTLTKLRSTYVDNLPNLVSKETGRLHTDFNQVVTATGRLSSSNPNLQNIPIRTPLGRQVRKGFISRSKDHVLLSADYSQIELRILAHMTGGEQLIDAFKKNEDIHARTAMEILGKKEITKDERAIGKTLNFALIYMQGPFATAKQLGISMKEAKAFIEKYFKAFPTVKPFMNEVLEAARENGYVETMFGRRRYFRNLNSSNKIIQKEEERQAFNSPLQGTAADIIKMAMISLHKALKEKGLKSRIILQVHDELILEVPKSELEEVEKLVKEEMSFDKSKQVELKVPLLVDSGSGPNWLEAK